MICDRDNFPCGYLSIEPSSGIAFVEFPMHVGLPSKVKQRLNSGDLFADDILGDVHELPLVVNVNTGTLTSCTILSQTIALSGRVSRTRPVEIESTKL
jgi:hypothetical protein